MKINKKLLIISLVIMSLVLATACGEKTNELAEDAIKQGKLAMVSKEYETALASFKLGIKEGFEDETGEVEKLIEILEDYKEALELKKKEEFEMAKEVLENINEEYKEHEIKEDVENLMEELEELIIAANEPEEEEVEETEPSEGEENSGFDPSIAGVKSDDFTDFSDEEYRKLNIFFSNISESSLEYYDSNTSNEDLVLFAYQHSNINLSSDIEHVGSEYRISGNAVNRNIERFFGRRIEHRNAGLFEYRDGYYYIPAADGFNNGQFSQVNYVRDNNDGTYTAEISIYTGFEYDQATYDLRYNPSHKWPANNDFQFAKNKEAIYKRKVYNGKDSYEIIRYY